MMDRKAKVEREFVILDNLPAWVRRMVHDHGVRVVRLWEAGMNAAAIEQRFTAANGEPQDNRRRV